MKETTNESFKFVTPQGAAIDSQILITCEHASNRLPEPYHWGTSEDLKNQHWAIDLGAEQLTRNLIKKFGSVALIANVSRLLIDYNRPLVGPNSETLFRLKCDDNEVSFNKDLDEEEKERRIKSYHEPYQKQYQMLLDKPEFKYVISVHSYTNCYEGNKRDVEIGILHRHECPQSIALAQNIKDEFKKLGYDCRLNEPWTGEIMDILKQAHSKNKIAFAIEVRQDILQNPLKLEQVSNHFIQILENQQLTLSNNNPN